ncbi:MAG: hypothetical protein V1663_01600 [archaeon]
MQNNKNNVLIVNSEYLNKVKKSISKLGYKSFHVISDFDRTLTRAFVDGEKVPSIISVLRDGNYLTKEYAERANALFEKYHPIEVNPNISREEKKKTMYEWWSSHFKLLIESGLNKKDLEKVVKSKKIKLRDGALEFIDSLHKDNIPLIILSSGGLGVESISMYLEKENKMYDNIHIISNSFEWDKNGRAVSVKQPIIHNLNKDETSIKKFSFFKLIKDRKNVLLLGDNLEDVDMVKGFKYDNLIKIGFLNENVDNNIDYYKKVYDIVILNDSSMDYVNTLLKEIMG